MPKFINSSKRVVERLKSTVRTVQDQHRERHKPTGFGFAFADRVDYLDRSHWDQPRYALVFDQATGTSVAALAGKSSVSKAISCGGQMRTNHRRRVRPIPRKHCSAARRPHPRSSWHPESVKATE